jgi:hypothetical protein
MAGIGYWRPHFYRSAYPFVLKSFVHKAPVKMVILFFGFLILLPWLASSAFAGVGGSISGTVTDPSGAVVAKATVSALNPDTGTRGPRGSNFGSNANQATIGNSSYNAMQVTLRYSSKRLNVLAGYTYGKSEDQSSNVGEPVNPPDPALSKALSSFDVRHKFFVSYSCQIPFENLFHATNRWTEGWEIPGITHFSTGLPVTLVNFGDNSLLGSEPNGINNFGVDEPDYTGAPLDLNSNPRDRQAYFNTAAFPENALGTSGTAKRRFFCGPGVDNYDMALLKNVRLTEPNSLQFRIEGFNVFNHAQFFGPQAVDGNIDRSTFGGVINAASPRLVQLGAKFFF